MKGSPPSRLSWTHRPNLLDRGPERPRLRDLLLRQTAPFCR